MLGAVAGIWSSKTANDTFKGKVTLVPFTLLGDATTFRTDTIPPVPLSVTGTSPTFRTDALVGVPVTLTGQV